MKHTIPSVITGMIYESKYDLDGMTCTSAGEIPVIWTETGRRSNVYVCPVCGGSMAEADRGGSFVESFVGYEDMYNGKYSPFCALSCPICDSKLIRAYILSSVSAANTGIDWMAIYYKNPIYSMKGDDII